MTIFYESNVDVIYKLFRGNTSDIVYVRPSVLDGGAMDSNWKCFSKVMDTSGTDLIDTFEITTKTGDNTEFKCWLSPTQTLNLDPDTGYEEYSWIIQLENSTLTPPIVVSTEFRLGVSIGNVI